MIHTPNGGKIINPLKFHRDDISLDQLAHALACQSRFFGHTIFPISVAQHAVGVSKLAGHFPMQGLHHDDSEAILGDINKWLKETPTFADYRRLETQVQSEFYRKFGCSLEMHPSVVAADKLAVRCEMAIGFSRHYKKVHSTYGPPTAHELDYFMEVTNFKELSWRRARDLYLTRHEEIVEQGLCDHKL